MYHCHHLPSAGRRIDFFMVVEIMIFTALFFRSLEGVIPSERFSPDRAATCP